MFTLRKDSLSLKPIILFRAYDPGAWREKLELRQSLSYWPRLPDKLARACSRLVCKMRNLIKSPERDKIDEKNSLKYKSHTLTEYLLATSLCMTCSLYTRNIRVGSTAFDRCKFFKDFNWNFIGLKLNISLHCTKQPFFDLRYSQSEPNVHLYSYDAWAQFIVIN